MCMDVASTQGTASTTMYSAYQEIWWWWCDGMEVFLILRGGTTGGCSWHNELTGFLHNSG